MARTTEVKLAPRPAQRAVKAAVPRQWPAPIQRVADYLREVWIELNRVDWPTRKELVSSTIVVVVLLLVMSFYLGSFDYIYTVLVKRFLLQQPLP
jgi:preprotein translocase subunit SecE